jgi:hypothetical protein
MWFELCRFGNARKEKRGSESFLCAEGDSIEGDLNANSMED